MNIYRSLGVIWKQDISRWYTIVEQIYIYNSDNTVTHDISARILSGNSLKCISLCIIVLARHSQKPSVNKIWTLLNLLLSNHVYSLHCIEPPKQVKILIDICQTIMYINDGTTPTILWWMGVSTIFTLNPTKDNKKGRGFSDHTLKLSWQLQAQSQKYFEFEAQFLSETFYYLRQAIHYMNPEQEALSFSYRQYCEKSLSLGCHLKRCMLMKVWTLQEWIQRCRPVCISRLDQLNHRIQRCRPKLDTKIITQINNEQQKMKQLKRYLCIESVMLLLNCVPMEQFCMIEKAQKKKYSFKELWTWYFIILENKYQNPKIYSIKNK